MNVIGLDLSLQSSGVALPGELLNLVPPDRKRAKGEKRTVQDDIGRLDWLEGALTQLLVGWLPGVAVLEGYSYGSPNGMAAIGEWGGIARLRLARTGWRIAIVSPNQLKGYATGRAGAGKDEVVSAVTHRAGILFEGKGANDRADAWTLRQMGMCWADARDATFIEMPQAHRAFVLKGAWPTAV